MIDIALLRENPEKVKKAIQTKNADISLVDTFARLDSSWREVSMELENLRREQKALSAERKIEEAKANKEKIKEAEAKVSELERERDIVWARIPNLPSEDTPVGPDESGNVVVRKWGEPTKFDFEPKDHMALGEALGIIDTETAAKVTGARFGYLKGAGAMLEYALLQFGLESLQDPDVLRKVADRVEAGYSAKSFVPVVPPVMIRPEVFRRMARLDEATADERYYLPADDLYLIGSAEHTLGPIHMDEILPESALPVRYAGFSTAFRREAGSYGKDTRGILRVHQFDKLEMESFTTAENSLKEQEFFVRMQEYLMQQLGLPYQVVLTCTGDQGDPDARHIDIETWMPGQNKYRETHSSDLMTDYQARRMNTKVKRADGKNEFVHTNDATAYAIGRTLIAIVENYQTKEGKIIVPEVLRGWVGKDIIG